MTNRKSGNVADNAKRITYAYLRVSTDAQDVANQKHGVLEYANARGMSGLLFVEDTISGKVSWRERKIGEMLEGCHAGDAVIFAEISRMARSTLMVLEILQYCSERQITVHIAKQNMVLDNSLNSKITATVLGLAAEIEREMISQRTKEALSKRKAEGMHLGRPFGAKIKSKLDGKQEQIKEYLNKGINKRDIARLVGCTPPTLYAFIEKHNLGAKTND
jgi:DNA invertase Pin-like site-specific DNA recombinase